MTTIQKIDLDTLGRDANHWRPPVGLDALELVADLAFAAEVKGPGEGDSARMGILFPLFNGVNALLAPWMGKWNGSVDVGEHRIPTEPQHRMRCRFSAWAPDADGRIIHLAAPLVVRRRVNGTLAVARGAQPGHFAVSTGDRKTVIEYHGKLLIPELAAAGLHRQQRGLGNFCRAPEPPTLEAFVAGLNG